MNKPAISFLHKCYHKQTKRGHKMHSVCHRAASYDVGVRSITPTEFNKNK